MMRWIVVIIALLGLGCSGSAQTDAQRTPATTASNEDGSVILRVFTSTTGLTTVQQLVVTAELESVPGIDAVLEPTDWEDAGWTLISQTHTPESRLGDRLVSTSTITLEPFLSGQYTVPSIVASAGAWKIATDPVAIAVTSVLAPDDAGRVAVTTELLPPTEPRQRGRSAIVLLGIGIGLLFAGAVFWWATPTAGTEPTPREQLELIAGGGFTDEHEALASVHRLAHELDHTDRLSGIIESCNHIRYTGVEQQPGTAQKLAGEALNALEGV